MRLALDGAAVSDMSWSVAPECHAPFPMKLMVGSWCRRIGPIGKDSVNGIDI